MQQHQMRGHSGVTMRKSFVSGVGGRGSGVSPKSPRSQRHRRHWEKRFATNDTKGHKGSDLVMGKAKPGAFTATGATVAKERELNPQPGAAVHPSRPKAGCRWPGTSPTSGKTIIV